MKRICSEKRDLDLNVENLKEWFRKRGYPEQPIKKQVARALQFTSNNSASNNKQEKETGIPLITTYHPKPNDISSLGRTYNTFIQIKKLRKFLHLRRFFLSGMPEI